MLAKFASLELPAAEGTVLDAEGVNPNCGSISVVGTVVVVGMNGVVPAAAATAAAASAFVALKLF